MKWVWTPTGGSAVTLGDDSIKQTILVEQLGGACEFQKEPLFGGANPFQEPRGNVSGQLVGVITQSFADVDLASAYLPTEYGRIGQKGSLAWTRAATLFTFAGATLQNVATAEINGVKIRMRYTFAIGAVS